MEIDDDSRVMMMVEETPATNPEASIPMMMMMVEETQETPATIPEPLTPMMIVEETPATMTEEPPATITELLTPMMMVEETLATIEVPSARTNRRKNKRRKVNTEVDNSATMLMMVEETPATIEVPSTPVMMADLAEETPATMADASAPMMMVEETQATIEELLTPRMMLEETPATIEVSSTPIPVPSALISTAVTNRRKTKRRKANAEVDNSATTLKMVEETPATIPPVPNLILNLKPISKPTRRVTTQRKNKGRNGKYGNICIKPDDSATTKMIVEEKPAAGPEPSKPISTTISRKRNKGRRNVKIGIKVDNSATQMMMVEEMPETISEPPMPTLTLMVEETPATIPESSIPTLTASTRKKNKECNGNCIEADDSAATMMMVKEMSETIPESSVLISTAATNRKKNKGRNGNIYIGVANRIEWLKLQDRFGFENINNFGNFVMAYMHKVYEDFDILHQVALDLGMFKEDGLAGFRWVNGLPHPIDAAGAFIQLSEKPMSPELATQAFSVAYDLAVKRGAFLIQLNQSSSVTNTDVESELPPSSAGDTDTDADMPSTPTEGVENLTADVEITADAENLSADVENFAADAENLSADVENLTTEVI